MKKILFALILSSTLPIVSAAGPSIIHFQGRLTYPDGKPILGSAVKLKFSLFSTEIDGSAIWENPIEQFVATNDAGLFATDIGPIPVSIISANDVLYLSISVRDINGVYKTLKPRQKLSSVPYAIKSEYSMYAESATFIPVNSVGTLQIKDGSVTGDDVARSVIETKHISDHAVSQIKLSSNSVGTDQLQDHSVTVVKLSTDAIVVDSFNLSSGAVKNVHVADGAIDRNKIALDSIDSTHIINKSIRGDDIADVTISSRNISNISATQIIDPIKSAQIESIDASKIAGQIDVKKVVNLIGVVVPFAGVKAPTGWLMCDGSAISRSDYKDLFDVIDVFYGKGNGTTTFNVPDLRGRFIRGVDGSANRDPDHDTRSSMTTGGNSGNNVGSVQLSEAGPHSHPITDPGHSHDIWGDGTYSLYGGGGFDTGPKEWLESWVPTENSKTGITVNNNSGKETRPVNAYLNYIIKY